MSDSGYRTPGMAEYKAEIKANVDKVAAIVFQ